MFRSRLLVFSAAVLSSAIAFAQPAQQADWRQTLPGATGAALGQMPNGDLVAAGIESPSGYDASYGATLILQRYALDGSPVWATPVRRPSVGAGIRPTSVLADAAGNTFVLGVVADFNFPICVPEVSPCPGTVTLFNAWWDVQKYSAAGVLLWERRQLQTGFVPVRGAVDAGGDLYLALDPNSAGRTTVVTRLSGATGTTLWSATTPDAAKPGALALTTSGTVVVAGASVLGLSINEYAVADGVRLTRTIYPAAAGAYAPGMAVGAQGQIAVTGTSAAGLFVALESASRQPIFSIAGIPGGQGRRVAVDGAGNVVVAGVAAGSAGTNWLLLRLDPLGASLHAPVVIDRHATALETPFDLVVATDGAAYVVGAAGPAPGTDPAAMQAVTARVAATGAIDWVAADAGSARALDADVDVNDAVAVLVSAPMALVHYAVQPVNQPPTSALRVVSTSGLTVGFDASGSFDPDGSVTSYRWTFGDGATLVSSAPSVTHAYAAGGTYTAAVTAVDALGLAGTPATTSVSVVAPVTPTSLALSASSIRGGNRVTGRVTLSSSAGAVVQVSSSAPTVASVPASVTVPAGQTSVSFTVTTSKVRTNTAVTITVTANGVSRSAVLTVLR